MMGKPKVVTVLGTRPEIIKLSVLIPLLDARFDHSLVYTSQHYSYNLAEIFFEQLGIRKPDAVLEIKSSDPKTLQAALEKKFQELDPALVIVYGDTNSTVAAARAAKAQKRKLAHIEAGLRSYDPRMPEEHNRVEADMLSDFLFVPTKLSKDQLAAEGITKGVHLVGNTIVDAVAAFSKKAKPANGKGYVLLTAHRQENVDDPKWLSQLLDALAALKQEVLFPMHPRTKKMLAEFGYKLPKNVKASDPVGYFEFLGMLKNAAIVLTDSGGVVEECACLHIPCLIARSSTERWELVAEGGAFITGSDPLLISSYARQMISGGLGEKMRKAANPFGDGHASERIASILKDVL